MSDKDWTDLGNGIRDMVDDAVKSQDFRKLNENICRTVTDGLDNISRSIKKNLGYGDPHGPYQNNNGQWGPHYTNGPGVPPGQPQGPNPAGPFPNNGAGNWRQGNGANPGPGNPVQGNPGQAGAWGPQNGVPYGNNTPGQWQYNRPPQNAAGTAVQNAFSSARNSLMQHPLYAKTFGSQAGGTALSAVGFTIAGCSAVGILITALVGLASTWVGGMSVAIAILAVVLGGSSIMAWKGTSILGRVKRFRKYVDGLKGRTYCSVRELAEAVGKNEKYVRNDLQKLIKMGWFKQGHMDRMGTCLIVSHETYKQYEETQLRLDERQKQESARELEMKKATDGLSGEVKEMIRTGNEYIIQIKKSNDAIKGEEISEKISHMQMIVEKIFQRVKEHPEFAPDLHKFMEYYLPTTVKLLDAYEELDKQPVQGENITNGKGEIEKTLDTLNVAFEKLLDSLFEDTAWDVATDISVLHTMLAQEGLTESGMKAKD